MKVDYRWGEDLIAIIDNVPTGVCEVCGEQYFKAEVVKEMERLAHSEPSRRRSFKFFDGFWQRTYEAALGLRVPPFFFPLELEFMLQSAGLRLETLTDFPDLSAARLEGVECPDVARGSAQRA